ncbi:MAG: immunoglobulin-like domain-containing protein [Bacteroidia bacterium]
MKLKKTYLLLLSIIVSLCACFKPDKNPPQIFLKGSLHVQIPIHSKYIEPGFKASDDRDGDLTYLVEVSDSVNTELAKFYLIYYNVTDASGNKANQVNRIVEVYHTINHLTTVYLKSAICTYGNSSNENVTINPKGGSETEFRISGITENGKTLNGYLYGNNKRLIKIPVQSFTDTIYFGEGIIDQAGNIIEINLNRQINTVTDTCNIKLTRYL